MTTIVTGADEQETDLTIRLLNVAYQVAAGESAGVVGIYGDAARAIGATSEQIRNMTLCGKAYACEISDLAVAYGQDAWQLHVVVFRLLRDYARRYRSVWWNIPIEVREVLQRRFFTHA